MNRFISYVAVTYYVLARAIALTSPAYAQSAFSGFYGQVTTGYEDNQMSSASVTGTSSLGSAYTLNGSFPSQNFGGAPLILGAGYYWQANESWLLGLGVDYSALSQTSSTFSKTNTGASIPAGDGNTSSGASYKLSNRFNIFLSPAYVIDKEKLVYLKAGYSQVDATFNSPTSFTRTVKGVTTTGAANGDSYSKNQNGYLLGLGYKQIIQGGLYGVLEANYMSYSNLTFTNNNGAPSADTRTKWNKTNPSLSSYQLLVGLGYAF